MIKIRQGPSSLGAGKFDASISFIIMIQGMVLLFGFIRRFVGVVS